MNAPGHGSPVTRVVVVGGGYVGLDACRALRRGAGRQLARGEVQVTVVNPTPYHTFHGFTGEALGGQLALTRTLTPLRPLLPGAEVVQGTVTRVDLTMQRVQVTRPGAEATWLPFDHLILGVGSADPFGRVPGLREHGWTLKRPQDMQAFRAQVGARFAARTPTTFNVIGGGYAGVEMAAALRERQRREGLPGDVHLISAGGVLDTLPAELAGLRAHARASLEALGVQLHEHARVQAVEPLGARLEGGTLRRADLTLLAAGIVHTALPGTEGLPRDERGRLLTDEFLRVTGCHNVWAGGDAACVRQPRGEDPANALYAMKHGLCIGRNVARSVRRLPLRPFRYAGLGQSASLGRWNAITELRGVTFTGPVAWLMRLLFFTWFMHSRAQGARVLLDLLRPPAPQHAPLTVPDAMTAAD